MHLIAVARVTWCIKQAAGNGVKFTMSATFYTTREMQDLLHVDRTTIYRMADSGRLPGIKVGNQWRFPHRLVEQWIEQQSPAPASALGDLLPLACVQQIQDTFADALGVTLLITDLDGRPVTRTSNACGYLQVIENDPAAHARCLEWWAELALRPSLHPTYIPSHTGLLCARGFIRDGNTLQGMLIAGGIAPAAWPPSPQELTDVTAHLGLHPSALAGHLDEVFHLDAGAQQRLLPFVQRIADTITHIVGERRRLSA
jgi:excisionase family DNA binding protein